MTKEQLLVEAEDLLRTMPPRPTIRHQTEENLSWFGRASALVEQWKPEMIPLTLGYLKRIHGLAGADASVALSGLLTLLYR
jgi:hypothetical protein